MFKKILLSLVVLGFLSGCAGIKPADQVAIEAGFVETLGMVFDNNPQLKAPMIQFANDGIAFLNGTALQTGVTRATVVNFITTQVSTKMNPDGANKHVERLLTILVNSYLPQWSGDTKHLINDTDKALLLQIANDVLEAAK